jgi:hypothetical protein
MLNLWIQNTSFFGDDVDDIQLKHKDYEHIAKYPVYNFTHYLTKLGFKEIIVLFLI